ncbi:MAG: histidine--tRNA ligase [Candidatus Uhrbacteria bacterium]|nr:histidine--tRNA ligase [Candidatus Uhrbacteria bacterium]
MSIIKPERPGGFNDYSPSEMFARRILAERIRKVYETFGFSPLETPIIEFEMALAGEEGSDMNLWRASTGSVRDLSPLALRFDHTVPLARYVAANLGQIKLPWRRWCLGPVFRGESTGAGRYHQFYQYDADIVGVSDLLADAEIIWMMVSAMSELTRRDFKVRWNSRKIINGLAEVLGITGSVIDNEGGGEVKRSMMLFRAIDKLEKIGWEGVKLLLERAPDNMLDTTALKLNSDQVGLVEKFLAITTQTDDSMRALDQLEAVLKVSAIGLEGIADCREVANILSTLGVSDTRQGLDFSVARGFGYYTGIVFETLIAGAEKVGSVYSGGRFDDLVARFTGQSMPSTGASIGFDRLFAVIKQLGELPKVPSTPIVALVMDFGNPKDLPVLLQILSELRSAQVPSEIYRGTDTNFKGQMRYAIQQGMRFLVIPGEKELAEGCVAVKFLQNRTQRVIPINILGSALSALSLDAL